jgi:hypothetical protein
MNHYERVTALLTKCLFQDDEDQHGAIMVEGILNNYGFHPGRLASSKDEIRQLIGEIAGDEFLKQKGGGMSFLNLCQNRAGELWGEHPTMEALLCLAIASNLGGFCAPRRYWAVMPGGMPYCYFDLGPEG